MIGRSYDSSSFFRRGQFIKRMRRFMVATGYDQMIGGEKRLQVRRSTSCTTNNEITESKGSLAMISQAINAGGHSFRLTKLFFFFTKHFQLQLSRSFLSKKDQLFKPIYDKERRIP